MLNQLKKQVYLANMEIYKRGLVLYTWGNASGIDRKKQVIAIKPSGVAYKNLKPEHMVLVDMKGNIVEGNYNPSSDTKTHLVLYNKFLSIGAVVHNHSTYSTIFAQARENIPCLGTTHADQFYGEIPVTDMISDKDIKKDYETETGNLIVRTFFDRGIDPEKIPAVLVASHGPFIWGKDIEDVVKNAVALEEIAKTALFTKTLNPHITSIKQTLLDKHYLRKHGKNAYYGQ
ncbi:L-ribulose-5-phosphate 4-epimerase [bacterium]|nr:L-ribulose-5-phosphate 4-epimerase [bacterium]